MDNKIQKILKDPDSENFLTMAALAFSTKNDPGLVWKYYIEPEVFCKHWTLIKRYMLEHDWDRTYIPFWQKEYERLVPEGKKATPVMGEEELKQKERFTSIGKRLSTLRHKAGMSQQEFAGKLMTTQQLISRIEKGDENMTLATLFKIAKVLKIDVGIELE